MDGQNLKFKLRQSTQLMQVKCLKLKNGFIKPLICGNHIGQRKLHNSGYYIEQIPSRGRTFEYEDHMQRWNPSFSFHALFFLPKKSSLRRTSQLKPGNIFKSKGTSLDQNVLNQVSTNFTQKRMISEIKKGSKLWVPFWIYQLNLPKSTRLDWVC